MRFSRMLRLFLSFFHFRNVYFHMFRFFFTYLFSCFPSSRFIMSILMCIFFRPWFQSCSGQRLLCSVLGFCLDGCRGAILSFLLYQAQTDTPQC